MGQATTARPTATGHTNELHELWAEAVARDPERCSFTDRLVLCRSYAWAVPDAAAIETIVDLGPVVEIGAGLGYWAKLVAAAGGDIVAYDHAPAGFDLRGSRNAFLGEGAESYFDVQLGGAEAVEAHPHRTLLLVWPPWDTPMASDTLARYRGDTLVYVGEQRWGCTGDDRFFEMIEAGWTHLHTQAIPRWPDLDDAMFVFGR